MKYQEEGIARMKSVNVISSNNNLSVILWERKLKMLRMTTTGKMLINTISISFVQSLKLPFTGSLQLSSIKDFFMACVSCHNDLRSRGFPGLLG